MESKKSRFFRLIDIFLVCNSNMNKYKLYPKCPKCEVKGPLTGKGIRQCLRTICKVRLYWKGGIDCNPSFNDPNVEERDFHHSKESIMIRTFKKYFKQTGFA